VFETFDMPFSYSGERGRPLGADHRHLKFTLIVECQSSSHPLRWPQ